MKLTLKLQEISYGDIAMKALPLMQEKMSFPEGAVGKILEAVTQLPENAVRGVLDAISMDQKNEILFLLVMENHEKLLQSCNRLLAQKAIGFSVEDFVLSRELELQVHLEEVDYALISEKLCGKVQEVEIPTDTMAGKILHKLKFLPAAMVPAAVSALPQNVKDDIILYFLNRRSNQILNKLEVLAQENGVRIQLESLTAEK